MQYKSLIAAITVACSAGAAVAMEHGEYARHNGVTVRYHQMARGVFSGVPAEKWDDTIHQRSDEEWDFESLSVRDLDLDSNDTLGELQERNLASQCQLAYTCVKEVGGAAISKGWEVWLKAATEAQRRAGDAGLIDFLKSPFFANAGGVAIAGIISAHVNGQANPSSCSTSSSEADVVGAAVGAAIASNPQATEISVNVNGPSGTWAITVSAASLGRTPNTTCG
ncbi:hypothetical protein M426DRAFT_257247 [Hypoxylon sp. CI-4A]|nr:hypothetical protein M426DRAFT_257247 [Hypoxylon sp. CI-4A]